MNDIKKKILLTIKKYYLAIFLFALATINILIMIQKQSNAVAEESSIKITLTLIYGAIIAIVIKGFILKLRKKVKKINIIYILIPILMIIVYYFVLNDMNITSQVLKYFILCLSFSLLFLVIPFINKKEDSDYFTYKVIISLIITYICYLILIVGIITIMGSISILFEISIKDTLYLQIVISILGFIMPTLFLSGLPEEKLKKVEYPNLINKILTYIILPILSIYTIVLYSYFIKILFTLRVPSNTLGGLVIYYSLFSIAILYFIKNAKSKNEWHIKFIKKYPYLLIVPVIMMALSIVIRINQYGFTEVRYYSLVCFIFVMLSIFIITKIKKVKYIPLVLSGLLLISTFGPQSASNISKTSQNKQLETFLIEHQMLKDSKIIPNKQLDPIEKQTIISILYYFQNMHTLKDVKCLPKDFNMNDMEQTFGFKD